jgi:hypothetical protein
MTGLTREDLLRSRDALRAQGAIFPGAPCGRTLRPYYCTGTNQRTGHPCRTVLLEAWAPAGAVVKRRCKQCHTWQLVVVRADDEASGRETPPLLD